MSCSRPSPLSAPCDHIVRQLSCHHSPAGPHPLGEAPGPHQAGVSLVETVQEVALLVVEDQAIAQSARVIHGSQR